MSAKAGAASDGREVLLPRNCRTVGHGPDGSGCIFNLFFFLVWEVEPRVSSMVGKCSISELKPHSPQNWIKNYDGKEIETINALCVHMHVYMYV